MKVDGGYAIPTVHLTLR